ncbi:MAG: hypothetical protein R2695_04120 [Acidimicrobiales bacterium]
MADLAGEAVTIGAVSTVAGGSDEADLYEATIDAGDAPGVPDRLDVTWTVAGVEHRRTIDVVGAYLFSLADVQRRLGARRGAGSQSDDAVVAARMIVETEALENMRRSMTPRARRVTMAALR